MEKIVATLPDDTIDPRLASDALERNGFTVIADVANRKLSITAAPSGRSLEEFFREEILESLREAGIVLEIS